ncbi:MAG: hypothetical protein ACOCR6_03120 [archaeon]
MASTIIGPPANELAEALESVVDDELQVIAEYDSSSYNLLFVADQLLEPHGSLESIRSEADTLFNYFHLDFLERELLEDLLWLGDVGTYVTFLDHGIIIRAQTDNAGAYIVMDVPASVDDVQIIIQNTLHDEFTTDY